jgi:hypothetical protein
MTVFWKGPLTTQRTVYWSENDQNMVALKIIFIYVLYIFIYLLYYLLFYSCSNIFYLNYAMLYSRMFTDPTIQTIVLQSQTNSLELIPKNIFSFFMSPHWLIFRKCFLNQLPNLRLPTSRSLTNFYLRPSHINNKSLINITICMAYTISIFAG